MNTPFNMGLIGIGGAMLRPGSALGGGVLDSCFRVNSTALFNLADL